MVHIKCKYFLVGAIFLVISQLSFVFAVSLPLGTAPQSIIDANPAGTVYILEAGVHRGYEIILKAGDTLEGEDGAVMSGAELLGGWRYESPYWVHDGPHSKVVPQYDSSPLIDEERARYPHDLFKNDLPIIQVLSLAELTNKSQWFYDYSADKIYVRFDPTNQKIELSGLCRYGMRTTASGVKLKNIRFEKYATTHQNGAVELGPSAVVEKCVIFGSHSVGIRVTSNSIIKESRFIWNGNAGFHNGGDTTLIEGNEFAYNGWAGFRGDWSRGGLKVPGLTNSTIRRNYAHHNQGPGIWFDINAHNNICEENLCEYNEWEGILFEMSCGGTFRRNICRRNGLNPRGGLLWGAPIVVQNSKNANVYNNYLEASSAASARAAGVTMVNQNRPQHLGGACGNNHTVEQNHIHNNVIVLPNGGANGLQYGSYGWSTYADFVAANNIWENNTYYTRFPHSYNFHWYVSGAPSSEFAIAFLGWQHWQDLGQDSGSQSIGKPDSFFNPLNAELDALILATTGIRAEEIKAPFREPSPANVDMDSDSIPDWWEIKYGLDPVLNDSWMDPDVDHVSNLVEYLIGTNPNEMDSDRDGMPDGWEINNGTNPLSADGHFDVDADGLIAREEYESSTHPFQVNALTGDMAYSSLSLWAKPGASQILGINGVMSRWNDSRVGSSSYLWPINTGPLVSAATVAGYPMMKCLPGNLRTSYAPFANTSSGWAIVTVLRPRSINATNISTAIMGNGVYGVSGFRLTMEEGILKLFTTQPQDGISISAYEALKVNEAALVSIVYDKVKREARLYINGKEQGRDQGTIPGNNHSLWVAKIGGVSTHPVDVSELLIYSKALTHMERREVEAMLLAKYKNMGLGLADDDNDGMPNWWELEFNTNSESPQSDPDMDGLTNLEESQNKTNPYLADSDGDTILDIVEINQGLNPWVKDDVSFDSDGDGLSLSEELAAGTDWSKADTEGDGMNDGWEVANNLQPTLNDALFDYDFDGVTNLAEMIAMSDPTEWTDVDGDGMHDRWEAANGLNTGVASHLNDPDGDGIINFWEFVFASNPLSPSPGVVPKVVSSGGGIRKYRYQYSLAANAYYHIWTQSSPELENWEDVAQQRVTFAVVGGMSVVEILVDSETQGVEYFRVKAKSR